MHLIEIEDPNDLIGDLTNEIEKSKQTNRLYVRTFENNNEVKVLLIYHGGYKIVLYDKDDPHCLQIDDKKYYITWHFLLRYIERFNILGCKRYTLIEMMAKEIFFIHNFSSSYQLKKQYKVTVKSRYGKVILNKSKSGKIHCVTYLNFGPKNRKYKKEEPQDSWFVKF